MIVIEPVDEAHALLVIQALDEWLQTGFIGGVACGDGSGHGWGYGRGNGRGDGSGWGYGRGNGGGYNKELLEAE
jgi:hypothetical protein